jgi:hypothetical protein
VTIFSSPRALALLLTAALVSLFARAIAADYSQMAPVSNYLTSDRQAEIALARTAAPPSISADADVLVLGSHGYETAVKGKNGFVCFVERSWAASFDDPEFWNPKVSSPNCFNPTAARTELPQLVTRTQWVMAGATLAQIVEKTKAAVANHTFKQPEPGAFSFMLSKESYINDAVAGPWLPHVMFFVQRGQTAGWGAGLQGSPIMGQDNSEIESTVLMIPVRRWSDGSPALPSPTPAP